VSRQNLHSDNLQIPLLQTKLSVPSAVSGLVTRQRINFRLDGGLRGGLTLVIAPAGAGKTTAAAQWIQARELRAAWLSLDAGDNDPMRFLDYLAAALKKLRPDAGDKAAGVLSSSGAPLWEAAVSLLIDELSELPFDVVLVLDDYHVISEQLVHEALSFLLRYAPQNLHTVLISRCEPPLVLTRLRTAGKVTELSADELEFTTAEAAAFYARRNIALTEGDIAMLTERTGGWAAGLQMAAMSLQRDRDTAAVIERFGGRSRLIASYFMEEVFSRVTAREQEFLLLTCVLARLSGPLCDAVAEQSGSRAALESLARSCGFVTPRGDEWYVYHHLFADFLRGLLNEKYPGRIGSLCAKAAEWCEAAGLLGEAVEYDIQGGDFARAAGLIDRLVFTMLDQGETALLLRWLSALPPATVEENPRFCIAKTWAAVSAHRPDEAERWLDRADEALKKAGSPNGADTENRMLLEQAVLRSYLSAKRRDIQESQRWLLVAGQAGGKILTYKRIRCFYPYGTSLLGGLFGWFGNLRDKARALDGVASLKLDRMIDMSGWAGYFQIANAETFYEWNQPDTAFRFLLAGMEDAQRADEDGALIPAIFTLAKLHASRGNIAEALQAAESGEKQMRAPGRRQWLFPLAALKARLNLLAGDARAVGAWLEDSRLDVYDYLSASRAYEHITLARVLLARARPGEAVLLLRRLLVFAQAEQWIPGMIETANLLAIACDAAGQSAEGMAILRENLARGREYKYLRCFVDEGAPMLALLKRLNRGGAGEEEAYVRELIALLRESPILRCKGMREARPAAPAAPLTAKELAVLRLAAAGLDNRSIAARLGVTLPTVKTHLANIYGKLGVAERRDAVERARSAGMIE